jgi:hypothetical protein
MAQFVARHNRSVLPLQQFRNHAPKTSLPRHADSGCLAIARGQPGGLYLWDIPES